MMPQGCEAFFGPAWPTVLRFAEMLADEGVERGLIGPSEAPRLWERHLLNSAAAVGFLPEVGRAVDLGSGAGLPGVVAAAMLPDLKVELVEPMERRTRWLDLVVETLGLGNIVVTRARAEELDGAREADAVMVRAVAPLRRLASLAGGLLAPGGRLAALKGRRAAEEVDQARRVLRKARLDNIESHEVQVLPGIEPTWVVTATKTG